MNDEPPQESEFNPPAVMASRAMFLAMIAALTGGILLTLAGLLAAHVQLGLAGLGALMVAGVSRAWLKHRGELEPAEHALEAIVARTPPPDDTRARELLVLLEQWEALERQRGSADFDPWALQALRNDIRRVVESDPALAQLFTELQRAA